MPQARVGIWVKTNIIYLLFSNPFNNISFLRKGEAGTVFSTHLGKLKYDLLKYSQGKKDNQILFDTNYLAILINTYHAYDQ